MQAMLLTAAASCSLLLLAFGLAKVVGMLLRCREVKQQYLSSSLPGPPVRNHILGHMPELVGPKAPWVMLKWVNAYGPLFKMQFLDHLGVVLTDPDSIARVTRKSGPSPLVVKPHFVYQALETSYTPKLPNIVTSEDNAYWKAVRQAAAPCFSMSNLKQVVPFVLELTQRAAERMAQHDSFDITDAAKRITSDVMGHLLYGEDLRGTHWEPSEYFQAFYGTIKAQSYMIVNPLHMWQLWDPEVRHQRKCLAKHNTLMGEKVKRLRENPPAPHTIAAHILSAIDPATGKPLNDNQAKAEISVFMAAGFETTSHGITWTLTMLASHPEVQDQVYAELQQAGLAASGDMPGRDFQASDLGRLPLLSAVIKESLRLLAPAPFGGTRYVDREEGIEICGHNVPKGTVVMIPTLPYNLAQHAFGPDALQFRPQRWMTAATAASDVYVDPDTTKSTESATTAATADLAPAPAPAGSPGIATAAAPAAAAADVAAQGSLVKQAAGEGAAPPDPFTFLTGARDCIGQNLAKLELQVVLATLLSRFRFSPGPELEQELKLAAATGQPAATAAHALAGAYITLQPDLGHLVLRISPRA